MISLGVTSRLLEIQRVLVRHGLDLEQAIELFWNDRSVETVLAPATGGAAPSR